jgi:hypothetical protein
MSNSEDVVRSNFYKIALILLLLGVGGERGFSLGFTNLNFESASIPHGTPVSSLIPATNAFPGWSATTMVFYDGFSTGGSITSIIDTNAPNGGGDFEPLQGRYSAMLFGGEGNPTILSQTGLVPTGAMSLQMDLAGSGVSLLIVSLGGQTIQLAPIATFANYTRYGGDISAFGGRQAELSFTEQPPAGVPPSFLELDNILFSTSPVPEPGTLALMGAGAVMLGLRHFRARRL